MRFGFCSHHPHSDYWLLITQAARQRAQELGAAVSISYANNLEQQIAAIDQFAAEGVDALLVGPLERLGLGPAIKRAQARGVPVLTVDSLIDDAQPEARIFLDNLSGGQAVASVIAERLGGAGKVALINGPVHFESAARRAEGMRAALARYPGIEVVYDQPAANFWQDEGRELGRAALAAHPDIQAICAANDLIAFGALEALSEAGRRGQVLVSGYDASAAALVGIRNGLLTSSVYQMQPEQGRMVIEQAIRVARSEPFERELRLVPIAVTADNLVDISIRALESLPGVLRGVIDLASDLAQERAKLTTMIDSLPDTYAYIKGRDGRYQVANRATRAIFGLPAEAALVGQSDDDLLPPEAAARAKAEDRQILASGAALRDQIEERCDADGVTRWYLTSKVPVANLDGEVLGLLGMGRDISSIRYAEAEQSRLREEIINAQKAALRELSTPLIPISDTVLIMPLIGAIDSRRAQQIIEALLGGVAANRAETVIIDITGVPVVDTHVADTLVRAARAVGLLGAQAILSGIRPEIAQTLVGLGVDLGNLVTMATLQRGVAYALARQRR